MNVQRMTKINFYLMLPLSLKTAHEFKVFDLEEFRHFETRRGLRIFGQDYKGQ